MRRLRYLSLSEFGIDHGFEQGRFCALGADAECSFNDYWWKETCRFEDHIVRKFPQDSVSVSSDVPNYKEFCIWPEEKPPLDDLCETSLEYLSKMHPDASVVMANPCGYRDGVGRIALTLGGVWVDQNIVVWLLEKSQAARFERTALQS